MNEMNWIKFTFYFGKTKRKLSYGKQWHIFYNQKTKKPDNKILIVQMNKNKQIWKSGFHHFFFVLFWPFCHFEHNINKETTNKFSPTLMIILTRGKIIPLYFIFIAIPNRMWEKRKDNMKRERERRRKRKKIIKKNQNK